MCVTLTVQEMTHLCANLVLSPRQPLACELYIACTMYMYMVLIMRITGLQYNYMYILGNTTIWLLAGGWLVLHIGTCTGDPAWSGFLSDLKRRNSSLIKFNLWYMHVCIL